MHILTDKNGDIVNNGTFALLLAATALFTPFFIVDLIYGLPKFFHMFGFVTAITLSFVLVLVSAYETMAATYFDGTDRMVKSASVTLVLWVIFIASLIWAFVAGGLVG